jgi:hypothetical protein
MDQIYLIKKVGKVGKKKPIKYPDPIITHKPQTEAGEERIAKNGWITFH